jgi:hypothetical protein
MLGPLERLLIGRVIVDRYEVEEPIGRGGMSIVYRARDRRLERPVALKVISFPAELGDTDRLELRDRLRREAAAAARIPSHPNVVQIYDYGTDPELDLDFLAMELLPGVDLKEIIQHGPQTPMAARRILTEAARGVAAGHRAGIIHRDVKPANVFLVGPVESAQIKILDFGIAKALDPTIDDELTRDGRTPHSPAYASPEQLGGDRVTAASDVYQLGLVGYEMITGRKPFTDADRSQIQAGRAVPLPATPQWTAAPEDLRRVIEVSLQPEPTRRFADAWTLLAALEGAASDDRTLLVKPSAGVEDETEWAPALTAAGRGSGARHRAHEEAQLAAAWSHASGEDDGTLLAPATPKHTRAVRPPSVRPAMMGAGIVGAVLLGWAAVQQLDLPSLPTPDLEPDAGGLAAPEELEETFRELIIDAFESLTEAVSATEGQDAARAVQDVITEIQRTWVAGDVLEHVSHYADEVDFRGRSGTTREVIAELRRQSIEAYPDRVISVDRMATEFFAPGQARVLVDRRWRFEGDEIEERGAREELVLVRTGEEWLVVAERELTEEEQTEAKHFLPSFRRRLESRRKVR